MRDVAGERRTADGLGQRLQRFGVSGEVEAQHMRTFASERPCDGLTDAAGGTRDEGEFGIERSLTGRFAFALDRGAPRGWADR